MSKRFGKYTSRLRIPAKKAPVEVDQTEVDKIIENVPEDNKKGSPLEVTGGGVAVGGGVASGGGIKTGGGVASGGGITVGGALAVSMPKIPFEFANHDHASRMLDNLNDYAFKHVQSAAAYIAGKHDNRKHHPIFAHRHVQTQHPSKYARIMNNTKQGLISAMKYDPHLREALSNSVHAAHVGGHLDMRPHHMNSLGGGIDFGSIGKMIKNVADPIEELQAAKDDFDKVGPLDKVFSSPRHFAKAALHGYAGNMRAHSAYGKAVSLGIPVVAPGMLPAATAMHEVADGLDAVNKTI